MCNLYPITSQQALRDLFKVRPDWDHTGNPPPKYWCSPMAEPQSSGNGRTASTRCY
jgi:hypothetical protein